MTVNHNEYRLFEYNNNPSHGDKYILGDVVITEENGEEQIGVIIQCHGKDEYRTDQFGNTCADLIRLATDKEIHKIKPELFKTR